MRVWKETYLPILEIVNSLCMGFLAFYAFAQVSLLTTSTNDILGNYSELTVLATAGLGFGYFLQILTQRIPQTWVDVFLSLALVVLAIWIYSILDRPFPIDTLFHLAEIKYLLGFLAVSLAIQISGLRESQMGGFLMGGFLFITLSLFSKLPAFPVKVLNLFLIATALGNLTLRNTLRYQNQFLPKRNRKRDFPLFTALYNSYIVLFLLNLAFTALRGFVSLYLSIFLFLLAYLTSRTLTIYRSQGSHHRQSFILGRNFLILNLILFATSFSWEAFSWVLYFNLGICLGYFKPDRPKNTDRLKSLVLGTTAIILCLAILRYAKTEPLWIHAMSLTSVFAFVPIFRVYRITTLTSILPLVLAILVSALLFQVPNLHGFRVAREERTTPIRPLPIHLSNLLETDRPYIYIRTGLPWDNRMDFPDPTELEGSIAVLPYNPSDPHLETYTKYLQGKSIPIILFVLAEKVPEDDSLNFRAFPGFSLGYSSELQPPKWNSRLSQDWKFQYIQDRLAPLPRFEDYGTVLTKLEVQNAGDLRKEIQIYKSLIHSSVREFCVSYYSESFYSEALDCIALLQKFGILDSQIRHIAFQSLNYTTPSVSHLGVLNELAKDDPFRIATLKKIYPIYDSLGDYKDATAILEQLIRSPQMQSREDADGLEQELARILLQQDKLEEVHSYISAGIRRNPESIIWDRLKQDYEARKEAKRRLWQQPAPLDMKDL